MTQINKYQFTKNILYLRITLRESLAKLLICKMMDFLATCFLLLHADHLIFAQMERELPPNLESYNVDPNSLTVSGVSSGGLMSPHLHFIYSSEIKGVGIFAGGPFLCKNNPTAFALCLGAPELQNVNELITLADLYSKWEQIDGVSNLQSSKVFIFHGTKDTIAKPGSGRNLRQMYLHYGANVRTEFSLSAGHGLPVNGNGFGGPCGTRNPDYQFLNECGYNGAYEMFRWLYEGDDIKEPAGSYRGDGQLLLFNQREFVADPLIVGMADEAFIYIPKNCASRNKTCKFHVALHGCLSNREYIGDKFARRSQYIDTAELNDIIVLFPQTRMSANNIMGCYDTIGLTGPWFATRWGSQPTVIRKMMKRVMGQDK